MSTPLGAELVTILVILIFEIS